MPDKSTILITGGAGYVGSYTALLLTQQGYTTIALDKNRLTHCPMPTIWIQGDYGDYDLLSSLFSTRSIDTVIHCAALDSSWHLKNHIEHYQQDVSKTVTLLKCMDAHNIKKIVFASSAAVYGNNGGIMAVDTKKNPLTSYGKSKVLVENILDDLDYMHGIRHATLRYFAVGGELPEHQLQRQCTAPSQIIAHLMQALKQGSSFLLPTHINSSAHHFMRDFIHVWDIAHANLKAYEYLAADQPSASFNIGTGRGTSLHQLLQKSELLFGVPLKTMGTLPLVHEPAVVIADIATTVDILGWRPTYSDIEFILKSTYAA